MIILVHITNVYYFILFTKFCLFSVLFLGFVGSHVGIFWLGYSDGAELVNNSDCQNVFLQQI